MHGRRTGQWNGKKGYLLCVNCHSPHEPQLQADGAEAGAATADAAEVDVAREIVMARDQHGNAPA